MYRAFAILFLLAGCAGQTVPDQVSASAVSGTPQAVIEGIARGGRVLVQVNLNNPSDQPIQVNKIAMTVLSVKPASCPSSALTIASFPRPILAPASTGTVLLKLAVSKDAPKSCSNARWQVAFASQATPAS